MKINISVGKCFRKRVDGSANLWNILEWKKKKKLVAHKQHLHKLSITAEEEQ